MHESISYSLNNEYIEEVVAEDDQKAPFLIATTPKRHKKW